MKALITLVCVVVGIFLLYMWLVRPNFLRKKETLSFTNWHYAHRGLWNKHYGIPENSLLAFKEAVKHGFGIELDIHITADHEMVVFHDQTLTRMCKCHTTKKIEEMTTEELNQYSLLDTSHKIPLFQDVLSIVKGQVPLLIEVKAYSTNVNEVCELFMEQIKDYKGDYIIESFNPFVLQWFKKNMPHVIRGQLSCRHESCQDIEINAWGKKALEAMLVNVLSRPDFIAYNYLDKLGLGMQLLQKWNTPMFAWTCRDDHPGKIENMGFQTVIFENHTGQFSYRNIPSIAAK